LIEPDGLQARIQAQLSSMSQGQKRLARFILDNPHYVAFASARDVGKRVEVSAATVVRFCQALGYAGYVQLQSDVREDLPSYHALAERIERRQIAPFTEDSLLRRALATDRQNIDQTEAQVDLQRFRAAVEKLAEARSILVVGGGVSAGAALFLGHSLRVLDFNARIVMGDSVALAVEMAHLQREDVVVGISVWRYLHQTANALRWAKARGAMRIVITDSPASPLAQLAEFAFSVGTRGVSHSVSLVGIMVLLDAFIAALAQRTPERTARTLRQVDAAFHDSQLLLAE
jgi:DNA-binding MurR/RpiR family transcriptional regulator